MSLQKIGSRALGFGFFLTSDFPGRIVHPNIQKSVFLGINAGCVSEGEVQA
jgi:hypothetical protein